LLLPLPLLLPLLSTFASLKSSLQPLFNSIARRNSKYGFILIFYGRCFWKVRICSDFCFFISRRLIEIIIRSSFIFYSRYMTVTRYETWLPMYYFFLVPRPKRALRLLYMMTSHWMRCSKRRFVKVGRNVVLSRRRLS
jgi:hypothetical protein